MDMEPMGFQKRTWGALAGCALGDAMGMPTEMLSREDIARSFPNGVHELSRSTPYDVFGRSLAAGEITDDTINTLLVARMLIESHGEVDTRRYLDYLGEWMKANPDKSRFVAGPNTMKALDAISNGTPIEQAGRFGTTNGGAMKISPIGVVCDYRDMSALVDAVERICLPTHNTSAAIGCASAIAAGVSYGVRGGDDTSELWDVALRAAREGQHRGFSFPSPSVSRRMEEARKVVETRGQSESVQLLKELFGTGVESVETAPSAFAITSLAKGNPWEAVRLSADIGGDTDTLGAITGAICGAMHPDALPTSMIDEIEKVNDIDFCGYAEGLAHAAGR